MKRLIAVSTFSILLAVLTFSCKSGDSEFDASGVFEATEIIVSSESSGKILELNLEEGDELKAGTQVGLIDCENLELQKLQAEATLEAINAKTNSATPQVAIFKQQMASQEKQIATLKAQLKVLNREQNRVESLVKAEAIPTKQLDDVNGQVDILEKQIIAAESQLNVTKQQISSQEQQVGIGNRAVLSERKPMEGKIAQVNNLIENCTIVNPIDGLVLVKYAENNEITGSGKALYKIAETKEMILRAYVTGDQLPTIKVNDDVTVFVDSGADSFKEMQGSVEWISSKAEFTPKTIQTKDERANLVYAIKVKVQNDGYLKIGMYGELKLQK